jgi:hypothetical protein
MKVQCCDCKMIVRETPQGEGITHTWCDQCVVKVHKQLWDLIHVTGPGTHYHPWATEDGKFMIFESRVYKGAVLWAKRMECDTLDRVEDICNQLNMKT